MEGFCKACLLKYEDATELLQYTEKNRRLFIYCTGLQVKPTDIIPFQICQTCFLKMKMACQFKKQCRTSDKRLNHFLSMKEAGEETDFSTYLQNNEGSMLFKFPLNGNSTPSFQKPKDDDNVSTSTSIRNFMTDFLREDEVPDTEANIIREMIEQEADVLDESLDSQWLQDDISIASDFRFSPFSTPLSKHNCAPLFTLKEDIKDEEQNNGRHNLLAAKKLLLDSESCSSSETQSSRSQKYSTGPKTILAARQILFNSETKSNVSQTRSAKLEPSVDNQTYIARKRILLNKNKDETETKVVRGKDMETFLATKSILPSSSPNSSINETEELSNETPDENNVPINEQTTNQVVLLAQKGFYVENVDANENTVRIIDDTGTVSGQKDKIDKNLEKLLNNTNDEVISLNALLASPSSEVAPFCNNVIATPSVHRGLSGANTPSIENILFGEKLDDDKSTKEPLQNDKEIEDKHIKSDENSEVDILGDFFNKETGKYIGEFEKNTEEIFEEYKNPKLDGLMPGKAQFDITDFSCKKCKSKFKSERGLKLHFVKTHNMKIISQRKKEPRVEMPCDKCGKIFGLRSNLYKHMRDVHLKPKSSQTCKICSLEFTTEKRLQMHMQSHGAEKYVAADNNKSKFICPICGHKSRQGTNHKIHIARHNKSYFFTCDPCGRGFYRKSDLQIHMRLHMDVKPFHCPKCPERYVRKDQLQTHLKRHAGELPFTCTICEKKYATSYKLKRHMQKSKTCQEKKLTAALKANKAVEESIDQLYVEETKAFGKEEIKAILGEKDATSHQGEEEDEKLPLEKVIEELNEQSDGAPMIQDAEEDKMSLSEMFTIPVL